MATPELGSQTIVNNPNQGVIMGLEQLAQTVIQGQTTGANATEQAGTPANTVEQTSTQPPESQSQRFAELAREQRKFAKIRQELQSEKAKIAEERAKYESYEKIKSQARLNPIEYLKQAGLTADDLAQFQLNESAPTPSLEAKQAMTEVERLRREIAERDERAQQQNVEQAKRTAQETMENFKLETKSFIESKPEDYELINMTSSYDLVVQTVEEHWRLGEKRFKESGNDPKYRPKILSTEEASKLVEGYLEGQVEQVLSKSKRFGSKYKKIEEAVAEVAKEVSGFQKTAVTPTATVKPIHNGLTSGVNPSTQAISMQQKMERALKHLQNSKNG
jgi:hypothetical protein